MLTPYITPPIAGITMASGTFKQQSIYDGVLSYKADAQAYADAIGAKLVNALDTPATNFTFAGIKPEDAAQPWMVTWDGVMFFFAGNDIKRKVEAIKAVTGDESTDYPGTYTKQSDGTWLFKPQPLTPPTPAPISHADDVAGYLAALNVPEVELTQMQRDQLLIAIAHTVGAKAVS